MFGWFKRKDKMALYRTDLGAIHSLITRLGLETQDMRRDLNHLKTTVDDTSRLAIEDVQGRYIKALEGQISALNHKVEILQKDLNMEKGRHAEFLEKIATTYKSPSF